MYTPGLGLIQQKPVYYDFPNLRYRADLFLLDGIYFKNFSSIWLNTTLYMITYDIDSCVSLDMGFGMMRPNWFIENATFVDTLWLAKKSDATDNTFHFTAHNTKPSPDGDFNYMYSLENATLGEPFSMFAPSPTGLVVNEYYDFQVADFTGSDVFTIPSYLNCSSATTLGMGLDASSSLQEKVAFIRDHIRAPLPEVYMAAPMHA